MRVAFAASLCAAALACATSPTGRKQLMLLPQDQMNQMGVQAFQEVKSQTPTDSDPADNAYVKCVATPITQVAQAKTGIAQWEIVVFKKDEVNAFALPGGKIGVYSGLLKVAKTPGQLAAVLGHETGHVIAKHGDERMSEGVLEQFGMQAVDAFLGGQGGASHNLIMGALGVGEQVGVALPHSRTQEAEADIIGEDLMAEAGFDPSESIELWKNMSAASQGAPPAWLSDHPADAARMQQLQEHLPESEAKYQQAKAAGRNPQCKR